MNTNASVTTFQSHNFHNFIMMTMSLFIKNRSGYDEFIILFKKLWKLWWHKLGTEWYEWHTGGVIYIHWLMSRVYIKYFDMFSSSDFIGSVRVWLVMNFHPCDKWRIFDWKILSRNRVLFKSWYKTYFRVGFACLGWILNTTPCHIMLFDFIQH